ncbi:hypothetical protein [Microbacterium trichothecenolyticum]|uniref:Enterobactin exporter EntS n=1 Tax=Microbacterium trichothecenolyticum TaxID=69370 RepID=A0ABU0TX15_MICTR|nr:hypothetical protein [Microbacterium trichothecenolyticum]MDQ1124206.1 hypothetical protein [Microbacterium trichothecenolyticum]
MSAPTRRLTLKDTFDGHRIAVAAILFSRLRLPTAPAAAAPGERSSILTDLREGPREFSRRRWVWIVVLQFGVLNAAFTGATTVLGPLVADETFGRGGWGLVVAAHTAGFAAGALLALRWRPRRALGIGVAAMASAAVPLASLALTPALPTLIAAFALGGFAIELFAIAWDQSLQTHVPRAALSRVYSNDMAGSFIAAPSAKCSWGPSPTQRAPRPCSWGAPPWS